MPGIMDTLSGLLHPMVPKNAIRGLQESISPGSSEELGGWGEIPGALSDLSGLSLGDIPEAAMGGLSGALEGLRSMTTPLDAASLMAPGALGLIGKAGGLADDGVRMGRQAFDVVENLPRRQSVPSASDVDALIGDLQRNMARTPSATGELARPHVPGLGAPPSMPAEFTARGAEGAYNAGRPRSTGPTNYLPPNSAPGGPISRIPAPPPPAQAMNARVGAPVSPFGGGPPPDPAGENLKRIEDALRAKYNQSYPGMGRGPR